MSAESDASDAALQATVAGPRSARGDAGEVSAQPIPDLIAADQYFAAKSAATALRKGLRFSRLVPPAHTGGCPGAVDGTIYP